MSDPVGGDAALKCLVISDGRRGIENQALGLAEACASSRSLEIEIHHVSLGGILSALPAQLSSKFISAKLPDCDIAIGCGRCAIPTLLRLKRDRPNAFTIYVQDPRMNPQAFDLVISPEHDQLRGPNVITMIGSPNRVTDLRLKNEAQIFSEELTSFPTPRALFLIGGVSKTHRLTEADHMFHVKHARDLLTKGYSLFITTSRRTPEATKSAWRDFAKTEETVWLYEGDGPNPYFAFLNAADMILVTEDSTNMLTESCATGKPVYRLPMQGKAGKFQTLYDALEKRCGVVRYREDHESKLYPPLKETMMTAKNIWEFYDRRSV